MARSSGIRRRCLLVLAYKAGLDIEATRERLPRPATLPFDPTYKLMATFNTGVGPSGEPVVRCFVKGAAPRGDGAGQHRSRRRRQASRGMPTWPSGPRTQMDGWNARAPGHGAAAVGIWSPTSSTPSAICLPMSRPADDQPGGDGRPAA